MFTSTEVNCDVVETICMNYREILMAGLRKYAGHVHWMAQLNPEAKVFEVCLVITGAIPFLGKVRQLD